jgi:hypothetical protein
MPKTSAYILCRDQFLLGQDTVNGLIEGLGRDALDHLEGKAHAQTPGACEHLRMSQPSIVEAPSPAQSPPKTVKGDTG